MLIILSEVMNIIAASITFDDKSVTITQISINVFVVEIYAQAPKKIFACNRTDVYLIDDTWSLDLLDIKG